MASLAERYDRAVMFFDAGDYRLPPTPRHRRQP